LAFARNPRLDDRSDAYRLFLAEELLDAGMSPAALMKGLGFDAPARGLAKYDPNQPRVPAGSGKNSGRWGSGGGAAQAPTPAAIVPTPAIASPPVVAAARAASALRAIAYQEQISRLNNPQRPLPAGMAVSLKNPLTGKNVAFDDCRESDGTMIEAKGPGYTGPMKSDFLADKIRDEEWLPQAGRQVAAAGSREIEWYFAEPEAAANAGKWFGRNANFKKIKIFVVPAEAP
jgi:hypothetical protein